MARDELGYSLYTMQPTSRDRWLAVSIAVITFVAYATVVPFAKIPLARIDGFLPALLAVAFITDLITAVLLFSQFSATRSPAILVLANGYLFSGLIIIPHALTFPGAFTPTGAFGAGVQSASWLYVLWRFGLAVSWLGYAYLIGRAQSNNVNALRAARTIFWSLTIALALVCTLTWGVTAGDSYLPHVLEGSAASRFGSLAVSMITLLNILALLLLWKRGQSILDLWVMVAVYAVILETVAVIFSVTTRFTLGWYFVRLESMIISKTLLIALLAETGILHARLSRANRALLIANQNLQRERESKLTSADAVVAMIGHEIKQPLTGITSSAAAGKRFLNRAPPDIERANQVLERIDAAGHRANEVFDSFRGSLKGASRPHQPVDVNALVVDTLQLLRVDLDSKVVRANMNLSSGLPSISGNKAQLQEVIINLVQNSIEAMATTTNKARVIKVTTSLSGSDSVVISIEDTGPGIDPQEIASIFEPFVTTKATGTGLGLAICKMLVEQLHGGKLSAASSAGGGARFEITVPTSPPLPQPFTEQSPYPRAVQ